MKDLDLLIINNHLSMQFVKSLWLKCFSMHLCLRIVLPSKKWVSQENFT
jgi:hypothetical protein